MKEDELYLRYILDCIGRIEDYIAGGRKQFFASPMMQDAVLRNLQVMAESTQRLSEPLKLAHPEVEWQRISGFRNVLVHGYLTIELDLIWEIVERDVPDLKRRAAGMLEEIGRRRSSDAPEG